jgi:hypothetical protein
MKGKKKPDNKNPPVKKEPEKENENQEKSENPAIITEDEKKMMEGQDHQEDTPQEGPESQVEVEQTKEAPKKQMLIKPRETYLQDKLQKMSPNKNLVSSIQKELGDKVKTIIKEENVLITEVPKDLNRLLPKKEKKTKNINEDYLNKQKYKEVKKMRDEIMNLKKNFIQLDENEKLLQDEGFVQLNSSQKGYAQNSMFDKSIKEQQLKLISDKKEELSVKIKGLEFQMKNIMEEHQDLSKKEKVKLFLENFERDKEIIEIRAKKYLKESKEREKRMKSDLDKIVEKRKKAMEEEDKKSKMLKDELIKEFKEKEKVIEKKQSKINEEKMLKYKPYINQKLEINKKNYLYNKRYENYKKREEKQFKEKYNKQKEEKEKVNYKFEDIEKFQEEFDEKLENRKYDQEQKSIELSEQWAKNKEKLPKSNFLSLYAEDKNDKKSNESNDNNENNEEKKSPFQKYGDNVRENLMPEIDEKLKKKREAIINSLEDPKNTNKKYTLQTKRKNRVLLRKRDNSKPSKFKWKLKLEEDVNDKVDDILNQNLVHKPKKVNLLPITRTSVNLPDKKIDYLKEIINKKQEKERAMSSKVRNDSNNQILSINKKSKKWEREINNKKWNVIDNLNNVKEKVEVIDQEADQKEKLLKLSGGIENNPELGRQVGSLLLDSIEAKINILKKMNSKV